MTAPTIRVPNLAGLEAADLTPAELAEVHGRPETLATLEGTIRRGMETFMEVGVALAFIREAKLYREAGFSSFERYVRERWDMDRTFAFRHIQAAAVARLLPIDNRPTSEAVARELVPLREDPGKVRAVWAAAVQGSRNGSPTAAAVRRARVTIDGEPVEATVMDAEPRFVPIDPRSVETARIAAKATAAKAKATVDACRKLVAQYRKIEGAGYAPAAVAAGLRALADELEHD